MVNLSNFYHWSCSSFADRIRGTAKPVTGTWQEWQDWEKSAKEAHPIRFFIAETLLDKIQEFLVYPKTKFDDFTYYINNRYISKTHAMTSTLEPGLWYDFDTRLLHCSFDVLVDFVEIEQAWHNVLRDENKRKQYNLPAFWTRRFVRTRSPESGLEQLKWASELKYDEDMGVSPGNELYMQPTPQALAALETITLYQWWKHIRPMRDDPYMASGWKDFCDLKRENGLKLFDPSSETTEMRKQKNTSLKKLDDLEKAHELEDTLMLKRLVDLRKSLWT